MKALVLGIVILIGVTPLHAQTFRSPVVMNDGQPVVAWIEGSNAAQVWVARWSDGRWTKLGPALNEGSGLSASYVSLASGPGGLVAAWTERPEHQWSGFENARGELTVAHWDGSRWQKIGPSLMRSENTIPDLPQIREDSQGRPWIMWSEITADFNVENVYAARWDGSQWDVFDQGTLTTDVSSSSRARDFLLDAQDRPVLAWSRMPDFQTDYQVAVGTWTGRWVPGPSANPNPLRYAGSPSMVFDQGRPLIAFIQAARGFDIWVRRWTGDHWESLGLSLNSGSGGGQTPRVVMGAEGPVVAWIENNGHQRLQVKMWKNGVWESLGSGPDASSADVTAFSLAGGSEPILAWTSSDPDESLTVARWTCSGWENLGRVHS
jgi:hypothetical protein